MTQVPKYVTVIHSSIMTPTPQEYTSIAKAAERDANTYQAKTGEARRTGTDESGVNSYSEARFEGSEVRSGDDLVTNRGYNRRIPPEEGGELDARGRQTRGSHFEGTGDPELGSRNTGRNDSDVAKDSSIDSAGDLGRQKRDILDQGIQASQSNVGNSPPGVGGGKYKGEQYFVPEGVPDSTASQGNIPPSSIID